MKKMMPRIFQKKKMSMEIKLKKENVKRVKQIIKNMI